MVMAGPISEFGLQKKICAAHHSRAVGGRQPPTHSGLKVVPPLVGRIDAPKAHAQREFDKRRRPLFLPRGAVEKIGKQ